jgi:YHS domain-containing protein
MFLRIVLIAVAAYFSIKALIWLSRYVRSQSAAARVRDRGSESTLDANEMVRDPACGVYISKREAIPATVNGVTVFFCSQKCLKSFTEHRG